MPTLSSPVPCILLYTATAVVNLDEKTRAAVNQRVNGDRGGVLVGYGKLEHPGPFSAEFERLHSALLNVASDTTMNESGANTWYRVNSLKPQANYANQDGGNGGGGDSSGYHSAAMIRSKSGLTFWKYEVPGLQAWTPAEVADSSFREKILSKQSTQAKAALRENKDISYARYFSAKADLSSFRNKFSADLAIASLDLEEVPIGIGDSRIAIKFDSIGDALGATLDPTLKNGLVNFKLKLIAITKHGN
jgi:hypothetical protein